MDLNLFHILTGSIMIMGCVSALVLACYFEWEINTLVVVQVVIVVICCGVSLASALLASKTQYVESELVVGGRTIENVIIVRECWGMTSVNRYTVIK